MAKLIEPPSGGYGFLFEGLHLEWHQLPVGGMWFQGPLLFVRLPALIDWCIDRPGRNCPPWNRKGTPPLITTSPSINYEGVYHGYVIDGVVTDDLDGHRYSDFGRLIK